MATQCTAKIIPPPPIIASQLKQCMMNTQQPNAITTLINLLNQEPPSQNLEITILPLDDYETTTCTSTAFLKDGIHFGIHAPHIPRLAREFRAEYHALRRNMKNMSFEWRRRHRCSPILDDTTENDSTSRKETSNVLEKETDIRFRESITCLLLLCPDHATGWADRRHLLLRTSAFERKQEEADGASTGAGAGQQEVWFQEIQFLDFMFTQHSKA